MFASVFTRGQKIFSTSLPQWLSLPQPGASGPWSTTQKNLKDPTRKKSRVIANPNLSRSRPLSWVH